MNVKNIPIHDHAISLCFFFSDHPVQCSALSQHLGDVFGDAVRLVLLAPFENGTADCEKASDFLASAGEEQFSVDDTCLKYASDAVDNMGAFLSGSTLSPWMEHVVEAQFDFLSSLHSYLRDQTQRVHLEHMRHAIFRLEMILDMDRCRVCGCTDDHACEGGCSWEEEDLCSSCALETMV